jgi:hypothetical protein
MAAPNSVAAVAAGAAGKQLAVAESVLAAASGTAVETGQAAAERYTVGTVAAELEAAAEEVAAAAAGDTRYIEAVEEQRIL